MLCFKQRVSRVVMPAIGIWAVVCGLALLSVEHAVAVWTPERNIEIIVGNKPGGGNDATAREIQRLVQMRHLINASTSVVNKPGGGGAVSIAYLNQQQGDGHHLAISSTTLLTNYARGAGPASYTDITPIALLFSDYIAFAVQAHSPVKDGQDFFVHLKKNPSGMSIGFSRSVGNANHIALALAARSVGVDIRKLKTVIFGSGGETITALLGGHVDAIVTVPSQVLPYMLSGKLRTIGISAPGRLTGLFAGVPTWKEQGVNSVFSNWRGVIGPRGLNAEQIAYWDSVFARLTALDEWKRSLEKNLWLNEYMNSGRTRQYFDAQYQEIKSVLTELGLAN